MPTQYSSGRNLFLYINKNGVLVPVGCAKTTSFTITTATADSTSQCDVGPDGILWKNVTPQANSFQVTSSGVVPILASSGQAVEYSSTFFIDTQISQQAVVIQFIDKNTGVWYGGQGWASSTKVSGAIEADQTYDVTIDGQGPLKKLAYS